DHQTHLIQRGTDPTVPPTPQTAQWNTSAPSYQEYPGPAGDSTSSQVGGLAPNIAAMLSYLLFGWIGGLIMYLTQKDREVRFHAAQSILTFGGLNIICWGAWAITWGTDLVNFVAGSFLVVLFFYWLLNLLSFVLWIFLSIQGYQLKHTKLPVVGAIAERWAAK
ncbi:MAG: DUF4870 domain-containing protein, partial [Candidatus Dormibacteraceae bacterium]